MWREKIEERGFEIRIMQGAKQAEIPTSRQLDEAERELGIRFPESYRTFCSELGPGEWREDIQIGAPFESDHEGNLFRMVEVGRQVISALRGKIPDRFDVSNTIGFATSQIRLTFHWKLDEKKGDEYAIYFVDGEAPAVKKIADTFEEFILETCMGDRLSDFGFGGFAEDVESEYVQFKKQAAKRKSAAKKTARKKGK